VKFVPIAFALAACVAAQQANPLSSEVRTAYTVIKNNLIKMAERMPEDQYTFKPTAEVQNFQQRMAHIADANVRTCNGLLGENKPVGAAAKTAKTDLIAAVKQSFATCDRVFDAMTDAKAAELVPGEIGSPVMPKGETRTRLSTLWNLVRHSNEMYGYMSVYLRVKGIVPPSTAPQD
jgi:uncharacterized damage-inducible protein DinB